MIQDIKEYTRFPIEGWLFPCWECGNITSSKTPIFYDKKIVYVPFCRYCKHLDIPYDLLHNFRIKYIVDCTLV